MSYLWIRDDRARGRLPGMPYLLVHELQGAWFLMKCKNCGERYDPRDSIEAEFQELLLCESKKKGELL